MRDDKNSSTSSDNDDLSEADKNSDGETDKDCTTKEAAANLLNKRPSMLQRINQDTVAFLISNWD